MLFEKGLNDVFQITNVMQCKNNKGDVCEDTV